MNSKESAVKDEIIHPYPSSGSGICPICGSNGAKPVAALSFYAQTGDEATNIFFCGRCGVFWRNFENKDFVLDNHYEISSYTNPKHEEELRRSRTPFFEQIIQTSLKYKKVGGNLLDFGCSYGHLLDVARDHHFNCTGIEIVDELRKKLEGRYPVHKSLDDVAEQSMDVVTCIDSLYCSPNPAAEMKKIARVLKSGGLVIVRIANRSYMLKFYRRFGKKIDNHVFGDQLYVLNDKAMRFLAEQNGMAIREILYRENKIHRNSFLCKIGYDILPAFCERTGLKLTPGLTYVLQKNT